VISLARSVEKLSRIVAVDSGKYDTKAVLKGVESDDKKLSEDKKIKFRTKMDITEEPKASDGRSCVVDYHGKKFLIGDGAETVDYDKSKAKNIHKMATYTAVAKLVEDEDEVILAIGCPLSIWTNVEERDEYKKYMNDEGPIEINLNGKLKKFTIKTIVVCPESSGIIFKNPNKYKDKLVAVIDIGGLNTNCCIYDRLIPVKSTCFTTSLGANVLRNELKQHLNSVFKDANLQDIQMEHVIKEGFIKSNKEESKKIIGNFLQKHIVKVVEEAKKKGWDVINLDFVFVGGGSKLLEAEIKTIIPDAEVSESAEWDNAEGFAAVASMKAE